MFVGSRGSHSWAHVQPAPAAPQAAALALEASASISLRRRPRVPGPPPQYWSDAELAELQEEDTLAEARQFRAAYEAACEVGLPRSNWPRHTPAQRPSQRYQRWAVHLAGRRPRSASRAQRTRRCAPPCPAQELGGAHTHDAVAWALSLVHSRSFVERNAHIWCPGIDLCNHTLQPNADIRRAADISRLRPAWLGTRSGALCMPRASPRLPAPHARRVRQPSKPQPCTCFPAPPLAQVLALAGFLPGRCRGGRGVHPRGGGGGAPGAQPL